MPTIECPECGTENRIPPELPPGKRIACGECRTVITPQAFSSPPLSHEQASALLKKAGPLSDPAKVCAVFFSVIALAVISLAILLFGGLLITQIHQALRSLPGLIVFGLMIIALPMSLWLMFRPVFATPVFYLRAFRSDKSAGKLRMLIRTGIGGRFRLSGIRPPSRRISWWSRLIFTTSTGFRYLHSNEFEMEAPDHNWMARLLASYAKARFVFIDVRDMTIHVEDEIRLSYLAMGPERSVFIIDPASSDEQQWRKRIGAILGIPGNDLKNLILLPYQGDEVVEMSGFMTEVRQRCLGIPDRFPDVTAAVGFARSRVPEQQWSTPFYEKAGFQFVAGVTLAFLLPIVVAYFIGEKLYAPLLLAQGLFVLCFFASALIRGLKIALNERRIGKSLNPAPRNPVWRPLVALLSASYFIAVPLVSSFVVVPVMRQRDAAKSVDSVLKLRNLHYAIIEYVAENDAYPSTRHDLADFIFDPNAWISPFAPGDPDGYEIHPGVSADSPDDTIIVEDRHSIVHGRRIVLRKDGSAGVIRLDDREEIDE